MDLFNLLLLIICLLSVIGWIEVIKDIKKQPSIKKYNLKGNEIYELKENIKYMTGREFEEFCEWLFNKTEKYKKVELTSATNDEGRDIILTDAKNEIIYVECKRYTENATVTEQFMIGREILQKLVGAMVSNNVKKGIVITTGNVHQNAWDYINKVEKNTDIKIDIINMDGIMHMLKSIINSNTYKELEVLKSDSYI